MTTPTTTQQAMIPRNAAHALAGGRRSQPVVIGLLFTDVRETRNYATSSGQPIKQCAEDGLARPSPPNRAISDSGLVIRLLMSRRRRRRALGLGSTDVPVGDFHDRPGSGGQSPPRVRSAMAISASGLR